MTEETPRLVLRRTNNGINDKVAIRLARDVARSANLYELFREGLVVEVLDIEEGASGESLFVTLGFNAPTAFQIDRVEKVLYPRKGVEIGEECAVSFPVYTADEVSALSLDDVLAALAGLDDAERELKAQITRIKKDRSKAADRGYAAPGSDRHHEWIMISEELDTLHDQLSAATISKRQLADIRKRLRTREHNERNSTFQAHFMELAKERLSQDEFTKLETDARALSQQARTAA